MARCAHNRAPIWKPHTFEVWRFPDRTPEEEVEATALFNSKLTRTADLEKDDLEWISQAAGGTLLKGVKA